MAADVYELILRHIEPKNGGCLGCGTPDPYDHAEDCELVVGLTRIVDEYERMLFWGERAPDSERQKLKDEIERLEVRLADRIAEVQPLELLIADLRADRDSWKRRAAQEQHSDLHVVS